MKFRTYLRGKLDGHFHVDFNTALGKVAAKRETVASTAEDEDPGSSPFRLLKAAAVVVQACVGKRDAGVHLQLDGGPGGQVHDAHAGLLATRGGDAADEDQLGTVHVARVAEPWNVGPASSKHFDGGPSPTSSWTNHVNVGVRGENSISTKSS